MSLYSNAVSKPVHLILLADLESFVTITNLLGWHLCVCEGTCILHQIYVSLKRKMFKDVSVRYQLRIVRTSQVHPYTLLSQIDSRIPFYHKGFLVRMGKRRNSQKMPLHVDFLDIDRLIGQVKVMASHMKVTIGSINMSNIQIADIFQLHWWEHNRSHERQ